MKDEVAQREVVQQSLALLRHNVLNRQEQEVPATEGKLHVYTEVCRPHSKEYVNESLKKGNSAKDLTRMLLSPLEQMCSTHEHSLDTLHCHACNQGVLLDVGRNRGLQHAEKDPANVEVLHKE